MDFAKHKWISRVVKKNFISKKSKIPETKALLDTKVKNSNWHWNTRKDKLKKFLDLLEIANSPFARSSTTTVLISKQIQLKQSRPNFDAVPD